MWLHRSVAAAAATAAAVLACSAPAAADNGSLLVRVPGDPAGFSSSPGLPLVRADRMLPGASKLSSFDVRNASPHTAVLRIATSGVVDEENGCLRQEALELAEDCASATGELSSWLSVEVTRRTGAGDLVMWTGTFEDLADGVLLARQMPAETTWPVTVKVTMAHAAGNDAMTDRVRFGVRLTATSANGSSQVLAPVGQAGAETTGGSAKPPSVLAAALHAGPQMGLPMTGNTISLWLLILDAFVLAAGSALVVTSRRDRKRSCRVC